MINLIGLCHTLRQKFPKPSSPIEIFSSVVEILGEEPSAETSKDIVNALTAVWKRGGWCVNPAAGAVQLEPDEEVLFHDLGLTIIKVTNDAPMGSVTLCPVKFGEAHPRVVWWSA